MKKNLCYNRLQLEDDMKNLPIGIQTFEKLILGDNVYVDKTKIIYDLARTEKPYFLSRPRRFGKSLLCSTFIALFQGKKELFKDLWIEKSNWDWKVYPVIHLDFSGMAVSTPDEFKIHLLWEINQLTKRFKLDRPPVPNIEAAFRVLIQGLAQQDKIVLIIDEYDNPILEHLKNSAIAEQMREILKNFYKTVKSLDQYFRFIFITGVTKFSQTTIFSGLNNLKDLTFEKKAATLCGYTHQELVSNFDEDIDNLAKKENLAKDIVIEKLRLYYNGYCFCKDEVEKVYNPFSILLCFDFEEFENYWIKTGTPSFLIRYVEEHGRSIPNLENIKLNVSEMETLKIDNLKFELLFLQAGYLTIKDYDKLHESYILSYPNFEVRKSFTQQIVELTTSIRPVEYSEYLQDLKLALRNGDIDKLCHVFDKFLKRIPYTLMTAPKERHYQLLFYAVIELLGEMIAVEDPTESGRIDSVIMTRSEIYIFEFKIKSTPEKALQQIEDKKYYEKFEKYKKDTVMIGISFNPDEQDGQKSRLEWKVKVLNSGSV
jgi:hypothetical protein